MTDCNRMAPPVTNAIPGFTGAVINITVPAPVPECTTEGEMRMLGYVLRNRAERWCRTVMACHAPKPQIVIEEKSE